MIARATHNVTTSASVTLRLAYLELGQEIVSRDEHGSEQQVEVGVQSSVDVDDSGTCCRRLRQRWLWLGQATANPNRRAADA